MNESLAQWCPRQGREELLAQWHPEKNGTLSPWDVSRGSKKKIWWRCAKGHEWQAELKSRSRGAGCPVCSNRAVQQNVNDLGTTHPFLAAQWHPEKNGESLPRDFAAGSGVKVWWRCELGHEWQASIASRAGKGSNCPVCSGKTVLAGVNDLQSLFPELAEQWHPEKNAPLTAARVTPSSNRRVWWRCEQGHEWQASVASRSRCRSDCPFCSGKQTLPGFNDLASLHPALAAQWDDKLNGALRPDMVTPGSTRKVWWRCEEGHVWKAVIYSRTGKRRHGCPVCAGKTKKMPGYGRN